jgi:muramoyltetrapeptide carboxypeptidase
MELRKSIAAIRDLGLVPRVPKDLFAKSFLFSNSDVKRLAHFKRALLAPDSKFIWCVRGGYGAIRLMPDIEKWPRPRQAKILLGYSDITTLHVHLNQRWHWPSLHGPLLDRLGKNALSANERRELLGLLFGRQEEVVFRGLRPLNAAARKARVVRAPVLGGNMAVLQSGLGTKSALKPKNCILYFEDIGERPHRVDRMLTQFLQAGWFKNCRAVALGDFVLGDARDRRYLWQDVMTRFAREVGVPVVAGIPVGHDPRRNRTLPFNTPAELHLGARPFLRVASGIRAR